MLGYQPTTNVSMGIRKFIEWYKSYENQFDVKDEKFIIKK